ncbi:MAG: hypothetical protein AAGI08_13630 [Bacteroidota bacterium]
MRRITSLLILAGLTCALPALAQPVSQTENWPVADSADVASIDAIILGIYDTISGPAGEQRDWDRMRSLMHPQAKLIPVGRTPDSTAYPLYMSIDQYIERAEPFLMSQGFFEVEIARKVETYGHVTHLFSTYESRLPGAKAPFDRGINSFQLIHDGARWWIVNIFWNSEESSGEPIPAMYGG